jgi:hypothetical protein
MINRIPIICWLLALPFLASSQDKLRADRADSIVLQSRLMLESLEQKYQRVEGMVQKTTEKHLRRIEQQEQRVRRLVARKDSLSNAVFNMAGKPGAMMEKLRNRSAELGINGQDYFGRLDSIQTSLQFLQQLKDHPLNEKLAASLKQYDDLKQKFQSVFEVERQMQARKQQIIQQLSQMGMVKELRKYRQVVDQYSKEVRAIKEELAHPDKIINRSLGYLSRLPAFDAFFRKHSAFAGMFPMQGTGGMGQVPEGLQTRQSVDQLLQQKQIGGMAPGGGGVQQELGQLQDQWNKLRQRAERLKQKDVEDIDISRYKPIEGKRKSVWDWLELGANIQTVRARSFFPVTSDIALSLGYKFGKLGTAGVGIAYKMGWGDGFNKIRISHQGLGLRSFVDIRIKGNFYVTGGAEMNYLSSFDQIAQLKDYSAWQQSGLLGVTKKLKVTRKMKGNVQLLWDFMSYQQVPRTQPFLFRVGYMIR